MGSAETSQVLTMPSPLISATRCGIFLVSGVCGLRVSDGLVANVRHWVGSTRCPVCSRWWWLSSPDWQSVRGRSTPGQSQPATWILVRHAGIDYRIWGFVLAKFFPRISDLAVEGRRTGRFPFRLWTMAFMIPFIFLLPATLAMRRNIARHGSVCVAVRSRPAIHRGLVCSERWARLSGTVASNVWIVPALGFARTLVVFAGTQCVLCGLLALVGSEAPDPALGRDPRADQAHSR